VTGETCSANTNSTAITADSTSDIEISCSTLTSGDKVKGDLSITFSKTGGLNKTTTGSLVTKVP
jgi:hypothetical protein